MWKKREPVKPLTDEEKTALDRIFSFLDSLAPAIIRIGCTTAKVGTYKGRLFLEATTRRRCQMEPCWTRVPLTTPKRRFQRARY